MPLFRYLLAATLLLAVIALAVTLLVSRPTRRRSSPVPWIFGGFLTLFGIFVVREIRWENLEWNPSIPDNATIVGTWQDVDDCVVLGADHRFTFRILTQEMEGTWTRDDFNLYLHGSHSYSGQMRFVQLYGRYRLMMNPPNDPDEWNYDAGLRQVQR